MRACHINDDGSLLLLGVTPKFMEMLRRLPAIACGDGAERFRAPDPMDPENRSPEARSLRDDWDDLVVPELHEVFDNQHCAVNQVLDEAEPSQFDYWLQFHFKKLLGDAEDSGEKQGDEEVGHGGEGHGDENFEQPVVTVDLTIQPELIEPWYGALNQGRLTLYARYGVSEGEFTHMENSSTSDSWKQAREHYMFYSYLQVPLLQLMQMEFDEESAEGEEPQDDDDFDVDDDDRPF